MVMMSIYRRLNRRLATCRFRPFVCAKNLERNEQVEAKIREMSNLHTIVPTYLPAIYLLAHPAYCIVCVCLSANVSRLLDFKRVGHNWIQQIAHNWSKTILPISSLVCVGHSNNKLLLLLLLLLSD